MARYIDANKLMDELNDAQIEFDENYKGLGKAKVMLSLQPTADVVEVKHGNWKEYLSFGCWHYDCPFCGDGFAVIEKLKTLPKYCSECGAKMDVERKDA